MLFPRVEAFPCGQVRCAGLIRMFWPETTFSIRQIGDMAGCSYTHAIRIADRMGLGIRPGVKPKVLISAATIRREYARRDATVHEIAAGLGIDARTLQKRAQKLGLPPRKSGRLKEIVDWPDDFDDLWLIGITAKEIISACKHPPKSDSQVTHRAKMRGLPRRGAGPNTNKMTLAQARAVIAERKRRQEAERFEKAVAERLRATAQAEREAWRAIYGKGLSCGGLA